MKINMQKLFSLTESMNFRGNRQLAADARKFEEPDDEAPAPEGAGESAEELLEQAMHDVGVPYPIGKSGLEIMVDDAGNVVIYKPIDNYYAEEHKHQIVQKLSDILQGVDE